MKEKSQRSSRIDVRNPLCALPAAEMLRSLDTQQRAALYTLLIDLSIQAGANAEKCWRKSKAPMATYWKAVSIYAKHTARILR